MPKNSVKLILLAVLSIVCILLYGFYNIKGGFDYAFPRRMIRVAAMVLTGAAIAYATVVFQTITRNRILTPSVMGSIPCTKSYRRSFIFLRVRYRSGSSTII